MIINTSVRARTHIWAAVCNFYTLCAHTIRITHAEEMRSE